MNYAAVNTKAVRVFAKYLKPQVPLKVLAAGNFSDGLKITEAQWGLDFSEDTHLLEANVKMEQVVYDALKSLKYFLQGGSRRFFEASLERYEMQDLKRIFRAVYHEENIDIVRNSLLVFDGNLLPRAKILTPDDLFKLLSQTKYNRMLSVYQDVPKDRVLFYIEMELDRSYYENLVALAGGLSKKDASAVMDLLNRHIDILNIFYIYRAKKNYDIMEAELENFVIRGGNISFALLREWVWSNDLEKLRRAIQASPFGFLMKDKRGERMNDVLAARDISAMCTAYYQKERMSLARIVALSVLLQYAIRDISTALEGLRLGFGKDMIRSLLTIAEKEGEQWQ